MLSVSIYVIWKRVRFAIGFFLIQLKNIPAKWFHLSLKTQRSYFFQVKQTGVEMMNFRPISQINDDN